MKITEQTIPHIEKAIGLKLYDYQKNYLMDKGYLRRGRATGKTVAYCIKLALSEGEPLDMRKPEEFSDGQQLDNQISYARNFFRREFMKYWKMLKDYGFPVREIKVI